MRIIARQTNVQKMLTVKFITGQMFVAQNVNTSITFIKNTLPYL